MTQKEPEEGKGWKWSNTLLTYEILKKYIFKEILAWTGISVDKMFAAQFEELSSDFQHPHKIWVWLCLSVCYPGTGG